MSHVADGKAVYAKLYGEISGSSTLFGNAVGTTPGGASAAFGGSISKGDLGKGPYTAAGSLDASCLKLDTSTRATSWVAYAGGNAGFNEETRAVAADAWGEVACMVRSLRRNRR